MALNRTRLRILIAAGCVFVVMGLVPPWIYTYDRQEKPAGYYPIISPPEPERRHPSCGVKLDVARYAVQVLVLVVATGGLLLLAGDSSGGMRQALGLRSRTVPVRRIHDPIRNVAIAQIVDRLYNLEPAVREAAIRELVRYGANAGEAIPHLVELRKDPVHYVRARAAWAIEQIVAGR